MTDDLGHHGPKGRDRRTGGSAVSGKGKVTWFSSGEDEGPDCGLSVDLENGCTLYLGEMPTATLLEHGITEQLGWWLVLYDSTKGTTEIAAQVVDQEAARSLFEAVAHALRSEVYEVGAEKEG